MHGLRGRIISGIALIAGALTAITEAAQHAQLVTIIPAGYRWVFPTVTIIALFLTGFSERIQGGASKPEVRDAAERSDNQKLLDLTNKE